MARLDSNTVIECWKQAYRRANGKPAPDVIKCEGGWWAIEKDKFRLTQIAWLTVNLNARDAAPTDAAPTARTR